MERPQSWNFATRQYEVAPPADQMTADQAAQYIPQIDAAQGLLRAHIGTGETVANALIKTLEAVCGIKR